MSVSINLQSGDKYTFDVVETVTEKKTVQETYTKDELTQNQISIEAKITTHEDIVSSLKTKKDKIQDMLDLIG